MVANGGGENDQAPNDGQEPDDHAADDQAPDDQAPDDQADSIEIMVRYIMKIADCDEPYQRSKLRDAYMRMCNNHEQHPVLVVDQSTGKEVVVSAAVVMQHCPNNGSAHFEGMTFSVRAASLRHHVSDLRPNGVVVVSRRVRDDGKLQDITICTLNLLEGAIPWQGEDEE